MDTVPIGMSERPLNILVVDDDPLVREVTGWMLSDAGHTVREAEDGVAALEMLAVEGADLLITDINMPRMNGLKLVQEVRTRWPGLPVLLVSGRPQAPGTQPFMSKPFSWDALIRAVARTSSPSGAQDV